jgi:hypothetical protein
MAKKKQRAHQVSKGEHSSVARWKVNAARRERSPMERLLYKQRAWKKGQNPWLTIANPNDKETNKRFIRVRANSHWGNPNAKPRTKETRNDVS